MSNLDQKVAQFSAIEGGKSEFDALMNRLETLEKKSGSGGGGMDGRIAKLEANVENIGKSLTETRSDTRDIRDRTIRLEEKVAQLPTKGFIVSVVLTSLAVIAALIVFQDKIRTAIAG